MFEKTEVKILLREKIEPLLLKVQKPSRYIGGEHGSIMKNKEDIDVRFAFCFPDSYDIGMSHLGMKILYSLINSRENYWCERVFAPWTDFEELMVENDIPLYALERLSVQQRKPSYMLCPVLCLCVIIIPFRKNT